MTQGQKSVSSLAVNALLITFTGAESFSGFPNADKLGGLLQGGEGAFRKDWEANNKDWSVVCRLDSDRDGFENGEEVGDIDCDGVLDSDARTWVSDPSDNRSVPKDREGEEVCNVDDTGPVQNKACMIPWCWNIGGLETIFWGCDNTHFANDPPWCSTTQHTDNNHKINGWGNCKGTCTEKKREVAIPNLANFPLIACSSFYQDFVAKGEDWASFCLEDHDGDNQSNGYEMGDEDCDGVAERDWISDPSERLSRVEDHGCTALSGDRVSGKTACVFPFKYEGKTYNSCTRDFILNSQLESPEGTWCPVKVEADGQVIGQMDAKGQNLLHYHIFSCNPECDALGAGNRTFGFGLLALLF